MSETYLNPKQVADLVPSEKFTTRTLAYLRHAGGGPVFSKPTARTVVYLRSDVDAWMREHRHTRTDRIAS